MRGWKLRARLFSCEENLGILLDETANQDAPVDRVSAIHQSSSRVRVLLVPTDEEQVIFEEVQRCLETGVD